MAAYRVVWECVVEQCLGLRRILCIFWSKEYILHNARYKHRNILLFSVQRELHEEGNKRYFRNNPTSSIPHTRDSVLYLSWKNSIKSAKFFEVHISEILDKVYF